MYVFQVSVAIVGSRIYRRSRDSHGVDLVATFTHIGFMLGCRFEAAHSFEAYYDARLRFETNNPAQIGREMDGSKTAHRNPSISQHNRGKKPCRELFPTSTPTRTNAMVAGVIHGLR